MFYSRMYTYTAISQSDQCKYPYNAFVVVDFVNLSLSFSLSLSLSLSVSLSFSLSLSLSLSLTRSLSLSHTHTLSLSLALSPALALGVMPALLWVVRKLALCPQASDAPSPSLFYIHNLSL